MKLPIVVIVGYLVGLPVLVWLLRDLKSFHRPIWVGYGNRDAWTKSAVALYAFGGWPVLLLALGWRFSQGRAAPSAAREGLRHDEHQH